MTALYAIPLALGTLALLGWIAATALSSMIEGMRWADPEARLGSFGRFAIAGMLGFGMAGISALFAGWPELATVGAAVAGAIGLAFVSSWLGPVEEE